MGSGVDRWPRVDGQLHRGYSWLDVVLGMDWTEWVGCVWVLSVGFCGSIAGMMVLGPLVPRSEIIAVRYDHNVRENRFNQSTMVITITSKDKTEALGTPR